MCSLPQVMRLIKREFMENNLKTLLKKHGTSLKKAFGQNFLTDENLLEEIVLKSGVDKDTVVLEIGCGAGALTRHLAKHAKCVYGYEIDRSLEPVLNETVGEYSNVNIIFNDVMKEKMVELERKLKGKYVLVANLPYYITTPIIMNFLENAKNLKSMSIMVQKEVADRLSAKEGTADYGAITVGINLRGSASTILDVPREKFTPVPNVDSAVVKIDIVENKFKGVNYDAVRQLVRAGFSSRRKMLINNIMNFYRLKREIVEKALIKASVSPSARGETLSAEQYVDLANVLEEIIK